MKYAYTFATLPFLASVVLAQDASGATVPDPSTQSPEGRPFAEALVAINSSTVALDTAILGFQGINQVGSLAGASATLLQTIQDQDAIIVPLPVLSEIDAANLSPYVFSLGYFVNETVSDLVTKKQVFVDTCVGPIVLDQLTQQQAASDQFQADVLSKIPDTLAPIAQGLAQPIADALSSGVSAFADQTALPASCNAGASTTTTDATTTTAAPTTTGSITSTSTTTTEFTSLVDPILVSPTAPTSIAGGSNVYPTFAAPTGGAYPTEDCEEEEPAYPTEDCEEEDGASPTGGAYQPAGSQAVWEPVPYQPGKGGNSGSGGNGGNGGAYPTGGSNGGSNGGSYGSTNPSGPANYGSTNPSGPANYGATNPSGPITASPAQPTGGAYTSASKPAVYTTSKVGAYAGAGVANNANSFGAIALAGLAAVALL